MEDEFLLSFELDQSRESLMIHGDEQGLRNLINAIEKLISNTKEGYFNHDHMMTPNWRGYELSEQNKGEIVLNGVKLYCWKDNQ